MEKLEQLTAPEQVFLGSMIDFDYVEGKKIKEPYEKIIREYSCDPCDACGPSACASCKGCAES